MFQPGFIYPFIWISFLGIYPFILVEDCIVISIYLWSIFNTPDYRRILGRQFVISVSLLFF